MLLTWTISEEAEDNVVVPVEGAGGDDDDDKTRSHKAYIKTDTDSDRSDNKINDNKKHNGTKFFIFIGMLVVFLCCFICKLQPIIVKCLFWTIIHCSIINISILEKNNFFL